MKKNGIKQIAASANCSCATVSRVLNNRPGISEPVRRKILAIAERLNYKAPPENQVVTVFAHLDTDGFDMYTMQMLYQISRKLHQAEFHEEVLFNCDIDIFSERYICGAISLLPFSHIAKSWAQKRNLPLVCLNDFCDLPGGVRSVCSEDRVAVREAVNFLYGAGHRRITLIVPNIDTYSILIRINAFREYTTVLGISEECTLLEVTPRLQETAPLEKDIARIPAASTAVLVPTEGCSLNVHRHLCALDREIAFMGWAYPWHSELLADGCPLMIQDFSGLAEAAVRMLREQLDGRSVSNVLIPYLRHKQ